MKILEQILVTDISKLFIFSKILLTNPKISRSCLQDVRLGLLLQSTNKLNRKLLVVSY